MKETNCDLFFCKRLRMLNYLISAGFTKYETVRDPFDNTGKYNWWAFKRTPELEEAVEEYFYMKELNR